MNGKVEIDRIVEFIQETFKSKGFKNAVIGISGGIDSAVITALCVKALGKEHVFGYALPCGEQKDINDSRKIAGLFDINYEEMNIVTIVQAFNLAIIGDSWLELEKRLLGNIASRTRANILYTKSAQNKGLVVGTSNRTELQLGYFTMGGDGLCAMEPIGHLYKTEVFELAKELGIPESIIKKAPTAGLWEGQTDEGEIGLTYKEIDDFLKWYSEANDDDVMAKPYTSSIISKKLTKIIDKNQFKLVPLPMLKRSSQ